MIGFEAPDLDQGAVQRHQVGAPQGYDTPVDTPGWYENDDWFSDLEDEGMVGVIVDDHTVYARHIMDNVKRMETEEERFDFRFWQGYQEALQNYTGLD